MKKMVLSCLLWLIPTFAFAETVSLSGKSYSLVLNDAVINMSGYQVKFFFTTYDGNRDILPYYYDAPNQMIYYSREFKKIGGLYYADYYCLLNGVIDDYGEISLNFGSIDSDSNGIDDICEINKSVNTSVTGNWYSHKGKGGAISGTMIKNSNSEHGYFNLFINDTWAGDIPATGDFYAGSLSGSATYSKADNSITAEYTLEFMTKFTSKPMQSSFEVIDDNSVRIIGKDVFPTTVFVRHGNKYYATVELSDGGLDTFWPDYQKWYYVIEDNNDSDKDGIPNLSDTQDNRKRINLPFLPLILE